MSATSGSEQRSSRAVAAQLYGFRGKLMAVTELQQLLVLQDLDTRADQLRYRKSHLPERLALTATETALGALAAEESEQQSAQAALESKQAELEVSLEAMRVKEAALAAQLSKSIVPREAETLQAEIRSSKQRRSDAEAGELAIMEELEPIEARLAQLSAQRVPLIAQQDAERAAVDAVTTSVESELAALLNDRAAAVSDLPAALVTRYEKMRGHLGGVAVARLDHGTCLGCNMKLSSKETEALKAASPDELVECEQCGRLLVR
jgi:uncharacterized protein